MSIRLSQRQRPEPDLMVVTASSAADPDRTCFTPGDVRLIVEVVSPDSEERDRTTKRVKYAEAGIRHYWIVERDGDAPVACTYELDTSTLGGYIPTGLHRGRLSTDIGFPVDIPLTIRA
jgi:Uma2 family endonuclease